MAVNSRVVAVGYDERDVQAAREAASLAREVENAVETGLGKTLAEHFGPLDCR
jgi:membrane protein